MLLRPLLPDTVLLASMPIHQADPARLLPQERVQVAGAVPKRQREYAAGRQLFRQLLPDAGGAEVPLCNDGDRVPLWPSGWVGSITHCDALCAVALADASDVTGLGIDIEPARPLPEGVDALVLREDERPGLAALPASWRALAPTLTFCAKEAVYKAIYPGLRVFLDFQQVQLHWHGALFTARIHAVLPADRASLHLAGRVTYDGQFVAAAVLLPQTCMSD